MISKQICLCCVFAYSGHHVDSCIVVRHLSPGDEDIINGGCGDAGEEEIHCTVAKRPYKKIEVGKVARSS